MNDMPQITVEYSPALTDAFDRRGFALTLHAAAANLIGSPLPDFKTRFHPIPESLIGNGAATESMIHVDLAILEGRPEDLKTRLGDLALTTLCNHIKPTPDLNTQVTVEVRDITNYHKRILP